MYELHCADMGHSDCSFVAKAETKDEVLKAGAMHVVEAHGMNMEELQSAEVQEMAMSMIKEV